MLLLRACLRIHLLVYGALKRRCTRARLEKTPYALPVTLHVVRTNIFRAHCQTRLLLVHDALKGRCTCARLKNTMRLTGGLVCGTHNHFQSSLSNPLVGHGPITRSRAPTRPEETIYLISHCTCNTQKNIFRAYWQMHEASLAFVGLPW